LTDPTPNSQALRASTSSGVHVVIVGGGFAGLNAAQTLRKAKDVRVTLVDKRNHHLFQPLLYQVATAALGAPDIAAPIRTILRRARNTTVLLAEVERVDPKRKVVHTTRGELAWDHLIVATGLTNFYFGHDDWAQHAPGLKSLHDALEIRRRVLLAFEAAEAQQAPAEVNASLTFVVVGGGPTGVELAGALGEIARHTLAKQFRTFDPARARIILVEGGPRVLSTFDEALSTKAQLQLERLGVTVWTGRRVTKIDARGIELGDERIEARTVLWAAGVAGRGLVGEMGVALTRDGRLPVTDDLSVAGHPDVFVVGDIAHREQDGAVVPAVAPAALQMGRHAAENVLRRIRGAQTSPFHYRDKGMLATIGRKAGVAQLGGLKFSGFLAWFLWLFVHIFFLIGFRNRLVVMVSWALSYLFWTRGARVILERPSTAEDESVEPSPHAGE